jgi:hypothetical protein
MFGKKRDNDGELPDLPDAGIPSMKDYQRTMLPPIESEQDIHGLPSFPDSLMNKGFSQSMIKSAVEDEDKNLPELPEWNEPVQTKPLRTMELDEWSPRSSPPMAMPQQNRPTMAEALRMAAPNSQVSDKRPLFVKLEKFKEARESLIKVSEKLDQMDELLKMIKDLKNKEDEEITSWEKDIDSIKARILFINKEIFENAY